MLNVARQLLDVPSVAPDDQRRSRLLTILLLGVAGLTLLTFLISSLVVLTGLESLKQNILLLLTALALLMGMVIILFVNRYWSVWLASSLFLLFLTLAIAFVDTPAETVNGRALVGFAIPIFMASVLLPPYASFIAAGFISLLLTAIALSAGLVPNPYAMLTFFVFALVSWLASRSLENALADLRAINRELDQRVEERTRDLVAALAREQAEASKNQAILESIADGVIVFDNQGKAIVANPALNDLIEWPSQQITGREIQELMKDNVEPADQETIVKLLKAREGLASSVRVEWGDKTLSVSVAPVRTPSDGVTGTVAVFRDFTREAEVERMKSAFVSMVSHDLRTPLSAIIGYADMLREAVYGALSEKQLGVMERINANAKRLLSLVNNLLDQAQIEAGKLKLHVTPFHPQELVHEMETVMAVLAQNKGLALNCTIDEDLPVRLSGDPQRLHQILVNLVSNAIKFTERGEIGVRLHRPDAQHWALEVSDTGSGISEEAQSIIFDPFGQADDPVTRNHMGVGLGLAIVAQLTVMMGGEVTLDSELGQGSTFTVTLPLTPLQEEVT